MSGAVLHLCAARRLLLLMRLAYCMPAPKCGYHSCPFGRCMCLSSRLGRRSGERGGTLLLERCGSSPLSGPAAVAVKRFAPWHLGDGDVIALFLPLCF